VHGDLAPGNIIVVGTTAKVSGTEFAVEKLEELTRPMDTPSSVTGNTRTDVGLSLAKIAD